MDCIRRGDIVASGAPQQNSKTVVVTASGFRGRPATSHYSVVEVSDHLCASQSRHIAEGHDALPTVL